MNRVEVNLIFKFDYETEKNEKKTYFWTKKYNTDFLKRNFVYNFVTFF